LLQQQKLEEVAYHGGWLDAPHVLQQSNRPKMKEGETELAEVLSRPSGIFTVTTVPELL
jgi:hypothetical protein